MIGYNFIFSNRIFFRLSRHLAFWLVFTIWIYGDNGGQHMRNLPACVLTTYTTVYFLIPRYLLRNKFGAFAAASLVCCILYPIFFVLNPVFYFLDPGKFISDHALVFDGVFDKRDMLIWKAGQWDAWGLTMCASGFAAVIVLMKLYYIENAENKRLHEKRVNRELQMLKAQLNARFLFDAMESIRQHVRNQSSDSSLLILNLSDLLSYILYENDERSVPLHKEIEMIEGYLKLENEGHGNTIDISVTQQGEIDEKRIVPLVLLPLVESCFDDSPAGPKNGAGVLLDFNVKDQVLKVTLKVSNLGGAGYDRPKGSIRLRSAKQRLNAFYTGRHQIEVLEDNQNYSVRLNLAL